MYETMHQRPIDFKNGLVDPNTLLEFMDSCHCADLEVAQPTDSHKLEFHHLYFPLKHYKNNYTELSIRRLRNTKYNLIEMLSCQEDYYHQTVETAVPKENISLDAAGVYLEESEWLTNYAATSWKIAATQDILARPRLSNGAREMYAARLVLLQEMQLEDANRLQAIDVIELSIVWGALSKYLAQKPESSLQKMVDQGVPLGLPLISTKVYGHRALRENAKLRLEARIKSGSWLTQKLLTAPAVEAA